MSKLKQSIFKINGRYSKVFRKMKTIRTINIPYRLRRDLNLSSYTVIKQRTTPIVTKGELIVLGIIAIVLFLEGMSSLKG